MSKFINILLNKGIKAPPLSWRTSWFGSAFNIISNSVKDFIKPNKLGKEFSNVMSYENRMHKRLKQFVTNLKKLPE